MVTIVITWWRVDVGDPFPVSEHRVASDRCCLHLWSRCPWWWWGWRHWRWHAADDIFIKHQGHLLSWSGDIQRDRNPRDENRSVLGARVDSHVHRRVGKAWMETFFILANSSRFTWYSIYLCDDGGGDDDEDDNYQHYEDDDQTDLLWVYETLYERRVSQEVWSGSSRQHTGTPGDQNSLRLFNMEMRNEEAFFLHFLHNNVDTGKYSAMSYVQLFSVEAFGWMGWLAYFQNNCTITYFQPHHPFMWYFVASKNFFSESTLSDG